VVYLCFSVIRHGRVQSVKLLPSPPPPPPPSQHHHHPQKQTIEVELVADNRHAILAFMDIRSASKAHNAENAIDGIVLRTQYNESLNASSITAGLLPNSTRGTHVPVVPVSNTVHRSSHLENKALWNNQTSSRTIQLSAAR